MIILGLFVILAAVLLAPFLIKKVEEELELFLFIMGCVAVTVSSQWSIGLIKEALVEPIKITLAVFFAGLLFRAFQKPLAHNVNRAADAVGIKLFAFLVIVTLGLLSSVITAIIASLVLVEIITYLALDRRHDVSFVVLACFSIGLGAALTPIGEPLSTIVISKLRGDPYQAGFFFLFAKLWRYIIPGVILFGLLGAVLMPRTHRKQDGLKEDREEGIKDVSLRSAKVYLFVMALVFLGRGFKPIIDIYISKISYKGLYWLNTVSAIVDNATLASAEIGPKLSFLQIKSALLGLLIAGGMLVPGNIPNIISAGKLKIKSKEWAKFGVPLGFAVMMIYFIFLAFFETS